MDLFKFNVISDPTVLESGQFINNTKSVMWVERYRDPGEFEIQALLSSGLRDFLPIGTLISHTNTYEVMIVENHEISEQQDSDPMLKISGRSFVAYLENRSVGVNGARSKSAIDEYVLTAQSSGDQAFKLINDHILNTTDPNDALVNVVAQISAPAMGPYEIRNIARGNVLERLMELLAINDLGVKTIRRNTFGVVGNNTQTILMIYQGQDKSSSVIFSWKAGDITGADYLFTNKNSRNTAMVVGRYVYVVVDTGPTKYNRRMIYVNANDIDGYLNNVPTGSTLTDIVNKMRTRGNQALKSRGDITISRADIADVTRYRYRQDFNIGDLVMLDGNYGQIAVMRVTEYVEIEDENGTSGHPTLSVPGG